MAIIKKTLMAKANDNNNNTKDNNMSKSVIKKTVINNNIPCPNSFYTEIGTYTEESILYLFQTKMKQIYVTNEIKRLINRVPNGYFLVDDNIQKDIINMFDKLCYEAYQLLISSDNTFIEIDESIRFILTEEQIDKLNVKKQIYSAMELKEDIKTKFNQYLNLVYINLKSIQ